LYHGKSGGVRLISVFLEVGSTIYFLLCYPKNVQSNLTEKQKKALRVIVEAIKKEHAP